MPCATDTMISLEQLSGEIAVLEDEKPTHMTMQKLAALYIVRDHMVLESTPGVTVTAGVVPALDADTEFAHLVSGRDTGEVLKVVSELMDTLQIMMPKLYDGVIQKLGEL